MATHNGLRQRLGWAQAQNINSQEALAKEKEHLDIAYEMNEDLILQEAEAPVEPPVEPPVDPPESGTKLDQLFDVPADVDLDDRYLALYEHWAPIHADRQSAEEEKDPPNGWAVTYYDRGFGALGMDWLIGSAPARSWGLESVRQYRDDYIIPNDGQVQPQWYFPEGLAAHYLLTDETASADALELIAERAPWWINGREDILTTQYRDCRIQGRAILAQTIAYLVTENEEYAEASRIGVDRLIQWFDAAGSNGRWDSEALPSPDPANNPYCGGMANFQILHGPIYALVRHHQLVEPIPRLEEILTKTLDRCWADWVPGEGFRYAQPPASWTGSGLWECSNSQGSADNTPAKDVSLLCSTAFHYGQRFTGLQRFEDMRHEIVEHGLGGSVEFPTIYMNGHKQFNQSYFRAWRHAR